MAFLSIRGDCAIMAASVALGGSLLVAHHPCQPDPYEATRFVRGRGAERHQRR